MSRKQVSKDGWTIVFGVDHATGAFVQVWKDGDQKIPENIHGGAQLIIDSLGVRGETFMDKRFNPLVEEFLIRFELFQKQRPGERPNLAIDDVLAVVRKIDPQWAKDIAGDVYQVWNIDPM